MAYRSFSRPRHGSRGRSSARLIKRCVLCRGDQIGAGECVLKIELFEVERIGRSGACARRYRAGTR
ncbi:hypothetical protein ELI02_06025 [Rhizobium leguminosarum]|uniref:Uncharacterized protein n=1 Tax=Rhizobium leguminosarum TaxID=384 RepID=A0A4Q8XMX1_RHILE|nr:hypothetical protein ELI28_04940 [Rhizobium leguminosarum]TAV81054.1 hypothetical protein ELI27_04940 [Rhizobium leguminosarum]TAV92149.1 hypothetical protein ELI22_05015 [Rhizobium leguminosarum]TAV96758.1 hypothetical protein ELI21_05000 [Rhizobium leguminosarum]TAW32394.1 hypothetical protein ELI19_04915 [Rhizobium leguminosarum]